ncbi:MAG: Holliday junction branch migration protein RuvA [Spirochaetaceae bacterium]|nr:MAG: Holliday junction branch migration protein RuvA [Spirochaetaceae bacterium]
MLNSLTGHITDCLPGLLRIQTGGVEWELEVSRATVQQLLGRTDEVRVLVYLQHRENLMRLYGFAEEDERNLFHELTKVEGIGPKQALRVLSGVSPTRMREILETEDINSLLAIPGLGKKTASAVLLKLRGVLRYAPEAESSGEAVAEDLVAGLVEMGYERKLVETVVREICAQPDLPAATGAQQASREAEIFRRAIVALG